jgi:hypothetical protein
LRKLFKGRKRCGSADSTRAGDSEVAPFEASLEKLRGHINLHDITALLRAQL